MNVEVIKTEPKPPIEKVIIELSYYEAVGLRTLLFYNESGGDLSHALERQGISVDDSRVRSFSGTQSLVNIAK